MTRWTPFEVPARRAARRAAPAAVTALTATSILLGTPPAARAIGPRAGEEPKTPAPPAAPAPIAIPEIPDLPEIEVYRVLESEMRHGSSPRGWYGIGLTSRGMSISRDDSSRARIWSFEDPPEITYVDPDSPAHKAGLRRGDKLTHVDGAPITSPEGGRRFGAAKPGESQRWTYDRDGKTFIATLVAGEHPDRALVIDPEVSEELQRSLARIRAEQAEMRAARRKMFEDQNAARSYERAMRSVEEAQRSLERAQEKLGRRGYIVLPPDPEAPPAPQPPEAPEAPEHRKLRYQGSVGDSEVEVLGTGSIVARKDEHGDLVITTPDATIRVRQKK